METQLAAIRANPLKYIEYKIKSKLCKECGYTIIARAVKINSYCVMNEQYTNKMQ